MFLKDLKNHVAQRAFAQESIEGFQTEETIRDCYRLRRKRLTGLISLFAYNPFII